MPNINVDLIENRLGIALPNAYRQLLSDYPQRLHDTKLDLGWKQEPISDRELYGDAERIIRANVDQRRFPTPWFSDDVEPWPDHMLVIGDDECGNYWCIDLRESCDRVLFYNHDLGGFEDDSDSLAEYVEKTICEIHEANRDIADRRAAKGGLPAE